MRYYGVLSVVIGAAVLACPAFGAGGKLVLKAQAGFGNTVVADRWCPVRAEIANALEDVTVDLLLEVRRSGQTIRYRKPIGIVGKGFRGVYEMYYWADNGADLRLRLVRAGTDRDVVSPARPRVSDLARTCVVGIVTHEDQKAGLRGTLDSGQWGCIDIQPGELPRSVMGYDALTALVVNSRDLRGLGTDQRDALRDWILSGGELYGVGTGVFWAGDSVLGELFPIRSVTPVELIEPELRWYDDLGGKPYVRLARPGTDASGKKLPPARMSAGEIRFDKSAGVQPVLEAMGMGQVQGRDAQPIRKLRTLAVVKPLGLGRVGFVAFPPASSALKRALDEQRKRQIEEKAPQTLDTIWTHLLCATARPTGLQIGGNPQLRARLATGAVIQAFMTNISGKQLPRGHVVLFLLVFCVAIVPADYIFLHRIRRFRLSLITFAAIITAFTAVAYAVASAGRPNVLETRTLTVVDVSPDACVMRGRSYGVAFSPAAEQHELATDLGGTWIALMGDSGEQRPPNVTFTDNAPTVTLPMKIWTGKRTCLQWIRQDYAPAGSSSADALAEAVRSFGGLKDCWLVSRDYRGSLGSVNAGGIARQVRKATPEARGKHIRPWLEQAEKRLTGFGEGRSARMMEWLSFGPANIEYEEKRLLEVQGLPTTLNLRRNIERGRVYLVGRPHKPPVTLTFSGKVPNGTHESLVRIDVTSLAEGFR